MEDSSITVYFAHLKTLKRLEIQHLICLVKKTSDLKCLIIVL